eukprot:1394604-Amphidinium_carterae.1
MSYNGLQQPVRYLHVCGKYSMFVPSVWSVTNSATIEASPSSAGVQLQAFRQGRLYTPLLCNASDVRLYVHILGTRIHSEAATLFETGFPKTP